MKYDVMNRFFGDIQFTADIDCDASAENSLKLGLAVKWAISNDANLRGADLRDADLRYADLSGVDSIPKITNIHQTVYAAASENGALNMGSWHTCETTHCRAGWVTVLAGEGGKALEYTYGTAAAAALIYQASDPTLERIPDFYMTNDEAMDDMKRLAEMEAAQ